MKKTSPLSLLFLSLAKIEGALSKYQVKECFENQKEKKTHRSNNIKGGQLFNRTSEALIIEKKANNIALSIQSRKSLTDIFQQRPERKIHSISDRQRERKTLFLIGEAKLGRSSRTKSIFAKKQLHLKKIVLSSKKLDMTSFACPSSVHSEKKAANFVFEKKKNSFKFAFLSHRR